jgi:Queuosine biosynthesis protein QueC
MSAHRLRVSNAARVPALPLEDFLWRPRPMSSSFDVNFGPRCEHLGPRSESHADLVRLAALVFLVDRTAPRPNTWSRDLELAVPVSDPDLWSDRADELEDLLSFLSGDVWQLAFERRRMPAPAPYPEIDTDSPVCLLSGGADSFAGALIAVAHGVEPALISHSDSNTTSGAQNRALDGLTRQLGHRPRDYTRIRLGRVKYQLETTDEFPTEGSSRTRSFLFIALGLAAAAGRGGRVLIPENGFASLNVPLAGERRGSLSTRTTHPSFLEGLQATLNDMGVSAKIENPLATMTKGQVFSAVEAIVGSSEAARSLSATHSCAKPVAYRHGKTPGMHCGMCYGCLVRRAAFLASGIRDQTPYLERRLTGDDRAKFMTETVRSTYNASRYAIQRGVSEGDILALGVPDSVSIPSAVGLAQAGLDELARVRIR